MKSIHNILASGLLCLLYFSCSGQPAKQTQQKGPITWMSFEQAIAMNQKEPRKIFIDVYTDWCGWCKRMDATTFMDSTVAKYMGEKYYAVKLNAETRDTIHFFDKKFVYKPESKANELALSLLSNEMSYPSFVMLDEKYGLLSPLPGYQTPDQLMRVIKYFGDNIYITKNGMIMQERLRGANNSLEFSFLTIY